MTAFTKVSGSPLERLLGWAGGTGRGRRHRRPAPVASLHVLAEAGAWSGERSRRAFVLSDLYRLHALQTAGEDEIVSYADTLPPDAWVNAELARRGERFRVHAVDGFRCEIYDV